LLGLTFGCAQNQTTPVTYSTEPPPPMAPTSDRPDVRIYSVPVSSQTAPGAVESPPASDPDVELAQSLSQLLKGDPYLNAISDNVEAGVNSGVVVLRGSVPTEDDRQRLENRVSRLPGVARVYNHLDIDLRY
jgi:hypothetical protein